MEKWEEIVPPVRPPDVWGKGEKRVLLENWTRVVGYLRPVQNFNVAKKHEFYARKTFRVPSTGELESKSNES